MKKYNIYVVTGTRAEYGLLRPLLLKLNSDQKINLHVIITGTHLLSEYGNTKVEVLKDGYFNIHKLYISMKTERKEGMAVTTGEAMQKFALFFSENIPDLLVVLGDRFEIFAAVSVAHMMNIPVAHISGGDVTEGAIDDALRHSMTKMSYLHFPGCEQSANRIVRMGEYPNRVFNVGELGVENCLNLELLSREDLSKELSVDFIMTDYCVVTFHPVTMEKDNPEGQVYELIRAMDRVPNMSYIITMANADSGGQKINNIWRTEGVRRPNWFVTESLGLVRYLSAMKYAKLVIGNSSSGIVEAPAFKTPTINIGDRQKGRYAADSVINVNAFEEDIFNAIKLGISTEFSQTVKNGTSPYGDGNTSSEIIKEILKFLNNKPENLEKSFYDVN